MNTTYQNGHAYMLPSEDEVAECYERGIFFNFKPASEGVCYAILDNYTSQVEHLPDGTPTTLYLNCPRGPFDNDKNAGAIKEALENRGCSVRVEKEGYLYKFNVTVGSLGQNSGSG